MDFSKLVEVFDRKSVTFVSVTQSFNTTTSMGRLTLNVLLSFAQFEREVTGERIRDKIAASKRKGIWMGGNPPLGYDVANRKLVVNTAEAETVRLIFPSLSRTGVCTIAMRRSHVAGHRLETSKIRYRQEARWHNDGAQCSLRHPEQPDLSSARRRTKAIPIRANMKPSCRANSSTRFKGDWRNFARHCWERHADRRMLPLQD